MQKTRQAVLTFIQKFSIDHNYPPTFEEIRAGIGASSKSVVAYHVNALEKSGYLTRVELLPRSIRLIV